MNLKSKMRSSCLNYCKTLKYFNPYVAGDIVSGNVHLDSDIDIVIYADDKQYVYDFIKSTYDGVMIKNVQKEEYSISSFTDIYQTSQSVKITATTKDPTQRDVSKVINAKVFFKGMLDE